MLVVQNLGPFVKMTRSIVEENSDIQQFSLFVKLKI